MNHTSNLGQSLVTELQNLLHEINPHIHELKSAFEFVSSLTDNYYNIVIYADQKTNNMQNQGHYNSYNERSNSSYS